MCYLGRRVGAGAALTWLGERGLFPLLTPGAVLVVCRGRGLGRLAGALAGDGNLEKSCTRNVSRLSPFPSVT